MLMITCVLKVVPEFGQFAAGFLGWSDPYCSLLVGAVIMMRNDVYMVFHVYEYSIYLYLYIYIYLYVFISTSSTCAACKHENGQDTPRRRVACLQIWAMSLCLSLSIHFILPNVCGRLQHNGLLQCFSISCTKNWTRHLPKILLRSKKWKTFLSWANWLVWSAALRYRSTILSEKFRSLISGAGFGKVCKMLQNCWHLMDALLGIFVWFLGCKGLRKINSQNYGPVENWPCELIFEVDSFSI